MPWNHWPKRIPVELARYATSDAAKYIAIPPPKLQESPGIDRVRCIYQELARQQIQYSHEKFSNSDTHQIIRTPAEVLDNPGVGTCLDLSLLFCGLCLASELLPLLIVLEPSDGHGGVACGHALVAVSLRHPLQSFADYERSEAQLFADRPVTDVEVVRTLVESQSYVAIECTGFANCSAFETNPDSRYPETLNRERGLLSFENAVSTGVEQLNSPNRRLSFCLDIATVHHGWGITPHKVHLLAESDSAPISFAALHELSLAKLPQQLRTVATDELESDLYVHRTVEQELEQFALAESIFRNEVDAILDVLSEILVEYGLEQNMPWLEKARSLFRKSDDSKYISGGVAQLKTSLNFDHLQECEQLIEQYIYGPEQKIIAIATSIREAVRAANYRPPARLGGTDEFIELLNACRRRAVSRGERIRSDDRQLTELRSMLPSSLDGRVRVSATEYVVRIQKAIHRVNARCCVVVGSAGTGKTTLLCQLARKLSDHSPVLLISGKIEITGVHDLNHLLQERLESWYSGNFSDWMNRISEGLRAKSGWFYVVFDAINENRDVIGFLRHLKEWLPQMESRRIRVFFSCRDVLWEVFEPTIRPYLFNEQPLKISRFTPAERDDAVRRYLKRFEVKCNLGANALQSLRNPLMLKFFCAAKQKQDCGVVNDLRITEVFLIYLKKVSANIAEQLGLLGSDSIEEWLTRIAAAMWEKRSPAVQTSLLQISLYEVDQVSSLYSLARRQNLIVHDEISALSGERLVRFSIDEFMEYMVARAWTTACENSGNPDDWITAHIEQAVDAVPLFRATLGAMVFFDSLLNRAGGIVEKFLLSLQDRGLEQLAPMRLAVLGILENIEPAHAHDGTIDFLTKFEPLLDGEQKDHLGRIVKNFLEVRPDEEGLLPLARRILEVSESGISSDARGIGTVHGDVNPKGLPPARHHFEDETKLTALAFLSQHSAQSGMAEIDNAISGFGAQRFHAALQGFRSIDFLDDQIICEIAHRFVDRKRAEYRIFCSWLMRERYGPKPSDILIQLLMDDELRVYRHTMGLFSKRHIEKALIENILIELRANEKLSAWHRRNFIVLLGRRHQFQQDVPPSLYQRIAQPLMSLIRVERFDIRKEAYFALAQFPERLPLADLLDLIADDEDARMHKLLDLDYFRRQFADQS